MASSGSKRIPSKDPPDVKLSKFLAYICRHGTKEQGIIFQKGGYIPVSAFLSLCKQVYNEEDVRRVVANCPLTRYTLKQDPKTGQLLVRANWGHSVEVEGLDLEPILSADGAPKVVIGTSSASWEVIKTKGLRPYKKMHIILFAEKLPDDPDSISDESSPEVLIVIDLKKALDGGCKFYRCGKVILSPGNSDGVLPPHYFSEVIQL